MVAILLRRAFASYESALHSRPLTTKVPPATKIHIVRLLNGRRVCRFASQAVTSAVIGGVGDLTCQCAFENRDLDNIDLHRTAVFTALGGVMVAPALHSWYSWLHRNVPGESLASIGRRLLLDQGVFAPVFIPSFMTVLLFIEGNPAPISEAQTKWWPTVAANWKLWVPAQLVNFGLVPLHFQVLFSNGVAVLWNTYLSWATHRAERPP